ncbi:sarcosine oxidase subunit gamma [Methylophaga sp.]|uniref:sarcosine oxidase subunit gamma n=1 Tax=Methylophaga sp. TaxID=2024840 RepID=UPI002725B782|nr:sarcosine oxidase subunit gamma [Methylophaga sp.]MDO8825477.1 sarcosine oxidase subunit gamma [Methylophaga sp.]
MKSTILKSPIAFAQAKQNPQLGEVNGMLMALRFADTETESQRASTLAICDASGFSRVSVKGSQAASYLQQQGMTLPAAANQWLLDNDRLVMRLGNSEFLIEDQTTNVNPPVSALSSAEGVHKVSRNDAAFILTGTKIQPLFAEICEIDLVAELATENHLIMTVIAGVSATLLSQTLNGERIYRLWCDGTYGPYLWKTLLNIIEEAGGGAVGLHHFYPKI